MAKIRRLIEDPNNKFEISNEDTLLYAQQIGINIYNEKHLMWIAKEGLSSNVPEPWSIYCDDQDRVFYYNTETCEESWFHPVDKKYASLVSEERSKSKSLNSASSDYGFESKLSSLADAPPLSSSGKNTPPAKLGRNDGGLSSKKIEFGQIENRRRTQLAPVRLNTLKMPVPASQKSGLGGMSFMPKGATLSKNIRRVKEEADYTDSHLEERLKYVPPNDDSNESLNSDEGSKYSYEESDDEEKHIHGLEPYDLMDTSQLSPTHSADESPDALEINSLVQLGTKMPPSLDNSKKRETIESSINKENSPSLSLRKVGQPSFLKPLAQASKKKGSFKESKFSKKESTKKNKYPNEDETDFEDKISAMDEEQKLMLEQLQKEWLKMQDELEKQEKDKYEEMIKISSRKLEVEEKKLRNENSEKISRIKSELQKKIEDEESLAEKSLQALKLSKEEKINEEKEKLQKELEDISETLKTEIKNMEEKKTKEVAQKQKEIEETSKVEIEKLELTHDSNKKNIEEAHLAEISSQILSHKRKIEEIQNELKNGENEARNKITDSELSKHEKLQEYQDIKQLIQEKTEKYNNLQIEKENLLSEVTAKKDILENLNTESSEAQKLMQELQDEVDKTENDLDLLRSEKSALISELSILKENIKNEKSNLLNLQEKVKLEYATNCSKKCSEVGINTHSTMISTLCKSSQISVSCNDASCQIGNISSVAEVSCQASTVVVTASKSNQVDLITQVEEKQISKGDRIKQNANVAVDKTLEKALSGLGTKLDSRINVIEHQLKSLQENLSRPSPQIELSSQDFIQNQFSEISSLPNVDNRNSFPFQSNDSSVQLGYFTNNIPISSQNKCKCELGDPASCDIMRDVKNSIYHLNNIVSQNFVPPLREPSPYQMNQPLTSYSSPFESFYAQLRNMQEKHRLTELKHKCEDEVIKVTKSSSSNTNESIGYFTDKEFSKPVHQSVQSNFYSDNVHDDPLIRARNLVLREQAKSWKQQQSLNSSIPNILSANIKSSLDKTQSSFIGLSASFSRPASQQSFFNLDMDPETDYSNWMKRLDALQLRIRSHKIL